MDFGITAFGAYVPRLRIDRAHIAAAHRWMAPSLKAQAKGARAFASWDEDAVTMSVEAARDALRCGGSVDRLNVLHMASTTSPYADLQCSAIVAAALSAPAALRSIDSGGSQRVGTSTLLGALKAGESALVVGADAPIGKPASVQEITYGAGAAAFVLGHDQVIARLLGSASVTEIFVDHFRAAGERHDYFWEERWVRDEGYAKIVPAAVKAALADAGVAIDDVAYLVMPSMLKGAAEVVARKINFVGTVASSLDDGVGYAGAAHALLMLAHVLETAAPREKVLLIGFGQGADALVLEVTEAIRSLRQPKGVSGAIASGVPTDSYLRLLSFNDGIDLEWGMRSEKSAKTAMTEQYRSADQMIDFTAGECRSCGTVQFPQLQACVKCAAPASQFDKRPLADASAEVLTVTSDWLSYTPAPPFWAGFVQFDNGARLLMEMVDIGPDGIERGQKLQMVFRIKEKDRVRGYNRYFWKSTPVTGRGD